MMKYIIELEDEPMIANSFHQEADELWKAKGFNSLVFDKCGLDKLTPYIEPDRKAIEDEVWEFVRAYANMNCGEHEKVYGNYDWWDVFSYLSYQEAKAKYDEWKKQKEEIHVGDEVKPKTSQRKGTVISEGTDYVRVLFEDVDYPFISAWEKKNVIKTGRHFDEVERLLERMREQK